MPQRSVLISGIGIAGPTLAYWLGVRGFEPTLVEVAPRLRTGGYVIDFWGRGYDIAERMGLLPGLMSGGYHVEEVRFVDTRGRRVGGFGAAVFRSLTGGRYISIPRGDLAKLIYERIDGRYEAVFGDTVVELEQTGDGVNVSFAYGPSRRFDLVVGADGLHSAVRRLTFGRQEQFERQLGYTVAAFETVGYRPRDEGVYVSYGVPGKQVARFAMRGDRTVFLFVFATEDALIAEPRDAASQKAVLRAAFDDAGWECRQILEALDGCDDIYFDRVSQIRMEAWSRGRVALIGDAAFCPSLLAGQGSALAMVAAFWLAAELDRSKDNPEAAFTRYEQALRPFITSKQDAAPQFAGSFAPRTRLGLILRNHVSRAFAIPMVAKLLMGPSLVDRIELPDFATPASATTRQDA